ncbi:MULTISPECIES: DUF4268 domain-containing protein [Flavobacteriaceae]|uniref:DUF4268 domain-containing protein n=2 Tax=Flavobacteriaceae TaxID=49546 RepID=A0A4Y8AVK3_9FLAO|nr:MULTISPECIES: DUF4268 domain-containing protein [Flavobacteriaceae]TEW76531.1 DUF4268 domain-containing protein [Gramella jeungdoensis]GGK53731.1 hypothetical protein GCM10007963_22570 [Lutibacter litoralis]
MFSKEESAQLRKEFWTSFGKSFPRKWVLYKTKIKDFGFKFVADKKQALVCLDIESFDRTKNELLFDQVLELKNILTEDYLPDVIFDELYVLESGKIIHRIYVKYNGDFNIHNKNTWQNAYYFFNEAMHQFEEFYEDYEDFIKRAIY